LRDWLPGKVPDRLNFNFNPSSLPNLPRPNVKLPRINLRPPNLPSAGGLAATSAGLLDVVQGLLLLLLAAAMGLVLWRVLAARATEAAARRGLGPWPIDPGRVATRADLIRAFEYLSLLHCGERARAWHHRAIADCLGGTEAARRAAAAR